MSPSGAPGAEPQRHTEYSSCFFLSYAHTPRVFVDGPDPNYWVRQFFRDLCNELVSCDPSWYRPTEPPGFMDDAIREGAVWRQRLARELATCRVFVPLYNRSYFTSENCGKEWAAFRARQMAHMAQTGLPNEAILPVIWKPPRGKDLPEFASALQMAQSSFSDAYFERGLYELIRLDRDREYTNVVLHLAERLDETARACAPPPGPLADYEAVRPLFPADDDAAPGERQFRITVAAPDERSAPPGRIRDYYGPHPEDWRPYHPDSSVPLARRAEAVARSLGYTPIVSALTRYSPELQPVPAGRPAEAVPDGPGVLLVDPWIAHTIGSGTVAQVDRCQKDWIRVLIPWSCTDPQTAEQAATLRALLEGVLPWSLQEWRRTADAAIRDLSNIADFGHAMPEVMEHAWRRYLRAARSNVRRPGFPVRPRLRDGPEPPAQPDEGSHD
ncbi:MAG: TIR-like protein FxsC [Catenulispora sp.]